MTSSWCCCCGRTWSAESASELAALCVLGTSRLPSCSSRSLCPHPRAAQFPGAGTGCPTATAPRRGARYTPLPREVSGPGWGSAGIGQASVCVLLRGAGVRRCRPWILSAGPFAGCSFCRGWGMFGAEGSFLKSQ